MSETVTCPTPTILPTTDTRVNLIPPYNVILLDDDHHSFNYVIGMLRDLFRMPPHKGMKHAVEVHTSGRTILLTTSKEHAELKQEQIHSYGPDPEIPHCAGSMTAIIEPAN